MSEIHHSKNVLVNAHIDANGHVVVGDGNNITVINLREAAQYKSLEVEIEALNTSFEKTLLRTEQYPDDLSFKQDLQHINEQLTLKQKDLETLKQEVLKLAEKFARIPLNTERLQKAREHFDKGEFKEARAVLDAEMMGKELDALLLEKSQLQEKIESNSQNLADKANEYLILAWLTAINFELPDRFEQAKPYFEESLKAERNTENIFAYAYFLHRHKQYDKAVLLYEETLKIYRDLAEINPQFYLPDVAGTLNNLALLHRDINEFQQAKSEYTESLKIYRDLAEISPQFFQPDVAATLNNLANLYSAKNEQDQAEAEYVEALKIYRSLAQVNQQAYLPYVALTLNNLANIHSAKNELHQAESEYNESLKIYQGLAEKKPQTFRWNVADTLNNLGILHYYKNELHQAELEFAEALKIYTDLAMVNSPTFVPKVALMLNNLANVHSAKNELHQAELEYAEALKIRRYLAEVNPQTYLPEVAMTAVNMGIFHLRTIQDKEKSIAYCKEALQASLPFGDRVPLDQQIVKLAIQVIQEWGEDGKAIFQGVVEAWEKSQK